MFRLRFTAAMMATFSHFQEIEFCEESEETVFSVDYLC